MYSSRVFRGCRALMAAAKAGTRASAPTASAAATKPRILSRPNGIMKAVAVSPALRKFLGVPEVSRTDAVKKIWEYIKLNNLQVSLSLSLNPSDHIDATISLLPNPANKREILCDGKLKTIFDGKDKVGFLEISRLLSCHFVKTN
ncbi:hypothetical protein HHK36_000549 [Tetracentron sinense]|uniref:SWIB domain-containing protein n=1 Tax=Tetracentron sinense TaxID=13715 RepID=A0A834ZS48_TETSI|nr:hypothetical protein HHK36_000549 [Tetracentron sinense]